MNLIIKNLNKSYDFEVLKDLNLSFDSNLVHLVGENGSGKSTLLKIIAGKISYESGEIFFNSKKVSTNYLANNCVLVYQDINLFLNESVKFNIRKIVGRKYSSDLIKRFGFENSLDKKVNELSGGFKKKLMLMISFMIKPKILLLDEYSSYIDAESLTIINELIKEYSKNNMVIYVDHNDSLNGKEKKISDNDEIDLPNSSKKFGHYIFKYRINIFTLFTYLFLMIFVVSSQVATSFHMIKNEDILANYFYDNNLWFQPVYLNNDSECLYYFYDIDSSINNFICFTNDNFPILIESDKDEKNECYVFSNYSEYFEKNVTIDGMSYFVKGIIDLNVDKYIDTPYEFYIMTFVVKGNYSGNCYLQAVFINAKNNIKTMYKEKKIMSFLDTGINNDYSSLHKVVICFNIIFIFISVISISVRNKKNYDILSSYKKSKINLFIDEILSSIINLSFLTLICYAFSYYILYFIYQKICPQYNVTFMRPFEVILISMISFLILYFIVFYFIAIKKRKNADTIASE